MEGAWVFPLTEDLQWQVERQVLTLEEAWFLQDIELQTMQQGVPWPEEAWPLIQRIRFADWPTAATLH